MRATGESLRTEERRRYWLALVSVHHGGGHLGGAAPREHRGQAVLTVADRRKSKPELKVDSTFKGG